MMGVSKVFILLIALVVSATKTTNTYCACCSALASVRELQGKIYVPGSKQYEQRLKSYYSANAALEPWCMVMPENVEDVSRIAKVISGRKCPFGIRSGAHSAWKGANGVQKGVTVDFGTLSSQWPGSREVLTIFPAYLNATTYDAERKLALIGPGSDWGHVYAALNPYGVGAVGGRASVVGAGGFTTGGGYSFHANTRGFACDSVENFQVVLANGTIVNANAKENSDLWKALKGGSGNFGFVTRIDQRVTESNRLWGGFVFFDLADRDAVYDAYLDFVDRTAEDPASQIIVSVQWTGTERILISVVSNIDAVPDALAFDTLLSINYTSTTTRIGDLAELVPQFTGATPLGLYANWMTGLVNNDKRMMIFIEEKHAEYVQKMQAAAPSSVFSVLVQFQPMTQSMVRPSIANGGNVLGLEDKVADGPTLNWLIAVTVDTKENQDKIHPLTLEYKDAINKYATEIGVNKDWDYLNYALGDQQPLLRYGSESVRFLKDTSAKYDPEGVFQQLRRSGFRLPH